MAGFLSIRDWLGRNRAGSRLASVGLLLWSASLPFAMAQSVRFTSVFLFVIAGGFLLHCLAHGFHFFRISLADFKLILPLMLLAVLPLLHFFSGYNKRELLLLAPLFFVPWMLFYLKEEFPRMLQRGVLLSLAASCLVLVLLLTAKNPLLVWHSVRSEQELPDIFLLARPQMGLLTGLLFFLSVHFLILQKKLWRMLLPLMVAAGILFWILAKMAIIALGISILFLSFILLKNRPLVLVVSSGFLMILVISGAIWLFQSGLPQEALSRDGLSFQKYPKAMVNSINSRIVLWKAGKDVLMESSGLICGIPSAQLELKLKAATANYNAYLAGQNLNPHNQPLYMLLHYGFAGLLVLLLIWYRLFEKVRKYPALLAAVLFLLICSQSEIYLDREFGTQLFMLVFIVFGLLPVNKSKDRTHIT
jgi:hypothetical protein